MKLPIKKKYFDMIEKGEKDFELRDAHITFVCEETGKELRKDIAFVTIAKGIRDLYPDVLEDDNTLFFKFSPANGTINHRDVISVSELLFHMGELEKKHPHNGIIHLLRNRIMI